MKNKIATKIIALGFHIAALTAMAIAQTTEFTFQGSLQSSGTVSNGNHEFPVRTSLAPAARVCLPSK